MAISISAHTGIAPLPPPPFEAESGSGFEAFSGSDGHSRVALDAMARCRAKGGLTFQALCRVNVDTGRAGLRAPAFAAAGVELRGHPLTSRYLRTGIRICVHQSHVLCYTLYRAWYMSSSTTEGNIMSTDPRYIEPGLRHRTTARYNDVPGCPRVEVLSIDHDKAAVRSDEAEPGNALGIVPVSSLSDFGEEAKPGFHLGLSLDTPAMKLPGAVSRELRAIAEQLELQCDDGGVIYGPDGHEVGGFSLNRGETV